MLSFKARVFTSPPARLPHRLHRCRRLLNKRRCNVLSLCSYELLSLALVFFRFISLMLDL